MPCYGVSNPRAAATTTVNSPLGFTENSGLTYLATGDPCLDFFFHVVPDTRTEDTIDLLQKAWNHNPLTTLKLIFNLRGIRGTGKSDKEGFFTCALWLHDHHPKTLAFNLETVPDFGCFKDLVEILFRLLEGPNVRRERTCAWLRKKGKGWRRSEENKNFYVSYDDDCYYDYDDYDYNDEKRYAWARKKEGKGKRRPELWMNTTAFGVTTDRSKVPREERVIAVMEQVKQQRDMMRKQRKNRVAKKAKRAIEKYHQDRNYRFLYDKVSELFAQYLRSDLKWLNSGELRKISLASRWCPSIDSAYDKTILICEGIARRIFPREEYPEYEGIEDAHYAYRVRDRLRKEVLVPLHKALQMPEIYMGSNQWGSLPCNRVPSVAMKTYKNLFEIHDHERFTNYLKDVKKGKAKIAVGALLPHEIIASLNEG